MAFKFSLFTTLFLALFTTSLVAQSSLRTNDSQQFLNGYVTRNYIKNSGAERNDAGVTDASNIHSRTTIAPLEGDGSHFIDATASSQLVVFRADDFQEGLMGQNCEARFDYTGDASLYKAYVRLEGVKVSADTQLVNVTGTQSVSINFPCGNSTSDDPDLVIESTGNGAAIKVDSVYLGKATNIGNAAQAELVVRARRATSNQAISTTANTKVQFNSEILDVYNEYDPTTNFRFTAKRAGNYLIQASLDVDNTVTGSHIIRIFKNGAEDAQCARVSYTESFLVTHTDCIIPLSIGDYIEVFSSTVSDSSYSIVNAASSQITISRIPSASEQGVKVAAPGLGWTAYTPTITHNSGGITNHTTQGYWKCSGSTLQGFITTTFSNTSAAFDGLRYSLPSNFTINTTASPIGSVVGGAMLVDTGILEVPSTVGITSSTALYVKYIRTGTTLDASPVKNIDITNTVPFTFNNTDTISIYYTVPVTASSPCPAVPMPLIKNAVTTSGEGVERVERAVIVCGSTSSITSQSGAWLASVGNVSGGSCSVTFAGTPFGSNAYACSFLSHGTSTSSFSVPKISAKTVSGFTLTQVTQSGGTTSADAGPTTWDVQCQGPSL